VNLPYASILKKCPKVVRRNVSRTAACLHCAYWAEQFVSTFPSAFSPVYGGLFVLTILAHYLQMELAGD